MKELEQYRTTLQKEIEQLEEKRIDAWNKGEKATNTDYKQHQYNLYQQFANQKKGLERALELLLVKKESIAERIKRKAKEIEEKANIPTGNFDPENSYEGFW